MNVNKVLNRAIHSMVMLNSIKEVFEWIMKYFVFGIIYNLTMIIINVCKYHYSYKFVIHTSRVIQTYYSQRQQQIISERVLILNKFDCPSKHNSKCLVICIFNNGKESDLRQLYVFSTIILCNNFVLILILSLYLLLLKDVRFAMVLLKANIKLCNY